MKPPVNVTLIVRIWLEPSASASVWRASVTNPRTEEKQYFQDPYELARFIAKTMPNGTDH